MEVFDVELVGFAAGRDPVADLMRAFGVERDKAQAIAGNVPVVVKKGVDEDTAERFFHLLRDIGAEVRINRRAVPTQRPPSPSGYPSGRPPSLPIPIPVMPEPPGGFEHEPALPIPEMPVPDMSGLPSAGPRLALDLEPGAATPSTPPMRPSVPAPSRPPMRSRPPTRSAPPGASVAPPGGQTHGPLLPKLLECFTYPFQRSAPAVFFGVALIARIVGLIWIVGPFLAFGVQAIFYSRVVQLGAADEDALPSGGEFTEMSDLLEPTFRFLFAFAVPFVPAVAAAFLLSSSSPLYFPAIALAGLGGLVYMPASVIVASLTGGCLGPLNPVAGIMIMTRVPTSYAITTAVIGATLVVDALLTGGMLALVEVIPIPFLPGLIATAIGMVLPTIAFRMLGVFLHHHEAELGL